LIGLWQTTSNRKRPQWIRQLEIDKLHVYKLP
jgi:hypothetical protein